MVQPLLSTERREKILAMIRDQGSVRVNELTSRFNVTDVTIRHDLLELAEQGHLRRTHGGAVLQTQSPLDIAFAQRTRLHREEKARIGKVAAQLVKQGETILFDGGSTAMQIARNIKNIDSSTFITVSPSIAEILASRNLHATIYLTAGELNRQTLAVEGPQVANSLQGLNIDKLFLAIHAFDIDKGLTDLTLSQAFTKKTLIEASREIILIADSSKFNDVAFATVAPFSRVNILVTDRGLCAEAIEQIEAIGVKVLLA
jgi:DeoR/GlpR family transcriptional regulator of sugar metabolism